MVGQPAKCRSYLELHDGPSEESPIIGKFCSQSVMANAVTTSNNLFVKFVTDGSGSLFRLGYTTRECKTLRYFFEVVCYYEEYPSENGASFIFPISLKFSFFTVENTCSSSLMINFI